MVKKVVRFGAQHLPPTSLLHALMQSATSVGLGSAICEIHEARQDHTLNPYLSPEL